MREILLVEDAADDAEVVAALLRRASPESVMHTVSTAASAIACLSGAGEGTDRARSLLPSLVLLDLTLPDEHGSAVLEWLSRRREAERPPVAVLTASADSEDLRRAYALGADAYLVKPITAEALADVIATLAPRLGLPVRVLIVDDNGDDRRLASDLLTGAIPGVTVLEAASLQEIEPVLAGGPFDAVVSDPYSTAGCGLDRLRYVRARCPDCAVVLLAGAAGSGELLRALRAGVDDYVLKDPLNVVRLGPAVRSAISRRRQKAALADAERSLRDSQRHAAFLADLLERASVAFGVGYPDGRLGACNAAYAELTGYSRADLTAVNWATDLTPPEWRDAEREEIGKLQRTGGPVRYEKEYRRCDGSRVPVELVVHLVRNDDGSPRLYFAFISDLTDRKRVETALRESEAKYRTILEGMMEGYWESDLAGNITLCNEATCEVLGRDAAAVVGMNNRAFMDAETAARVYATFSRVRATGEPARALDWELIRGDGRRVAVEVSVRLRRDGAGTPVGFAGALRDVSERRHLEEQLRHSQKMEAVGVLAGGVAHDFNNLLQAMLGQLQLLRRQSDAPERVVALTREMDALVARGASLTRQLLLFSRRETSRPERLDLARLLAESASMLQRLVPANIDLEVDAPSVALPVEADRGQLEQVLVNLTVNAADAMIGGGALRLRAERCDAATVQLVVEDTGYGIPADLQQRVFEPFFTTKPPGKGTGLGLAVVHGIVARHGGRVELASVVGRGTTVTVLLPALAGGASCSELAPPAALPDAPAGQGERVLVVEDEASTRESLLGIIEALGYRVAATASAEEALALAADTPFDLLITDLMLPGLPGPRLAAELQERRPALKIILMSGYAKDEAVRLGVFAGVVRFLQKPFDIDTLAREVRAALDDTGG